MSSQSVGKYVPTRRVSWLSTTYRAMRSYATSSNLIGLICGVALIFLLLVTPLPWNIRLPLYLSVLVWTMLRPRVALYLMPISIPWGSIDFIDIKGLRLSSADLLVVFLAIGGLLSFGLSQQKAGHIDSEPSNIPHLLVAHMLQIVA